MGAASEVQGVLPRVSQANAPAGPFSAHAGTGEVSPGSLMRVNLSPRTSPATSLPRSQPLCERPAELGWTAAVPLLSGTRHRWLGGPNARRPWDTGEFSCPADPAQLDQIDAAQVIQDMWDGEMPSGGEEDDEEWAAMRAPFSTHFPGLAPPAGTPLSPGELDDVLRSLPPRRIGLVPAARPADVLPLTGWTPADQSDALPIAGGAHRADLGRRELTLMSR